MDFRKQFMTVTPLSKTLALILVIALPFAGFYLGVEYQASLGVQRDVVVSSTRSDVEQIKIALASRHDTVASEVSYLHIEENNGQFAWGQVGIGTGPGSGGVFFAAKQHGQWIIVADGNGIPECTNFDTYNYPRDMYGGCVETDGTLRKTSQ